MAMTERDEKRARLLARAGGSDENRPRFWLGHDIRDERVPLEPMGDPTDD